ncbi:hypothetical protein BAUCODRAFT_45509, partial [Baudoinia panamericana UAMH 10762]
VQIITGSYERVLHGVSARIPRRLLQDHPIEEDDTIQELHASFSDTFLLSTHSSAIRCLALSPPTDASKRFLATGSSDERINVYTISTAPPPAHPSKGSSALPTLTSDSVAENPRNRSLGSLIHHDRAVTRLHFATKSKLFSAAEDNTIAISRTRDWTVLSSIKAPIPKPQGRPSGDTAGPGDMPAGVNDFAIHPSQKLMLSVGRGERCLRLWNLMTGKKAGVLNFDRALLAQVGEGKYGDGEGRHVLWDAKGEAYVVGFERGAAVFGIDSKARCVIKATPATKLHQMQFARFGGSQATEHGGESELLAIATEDGRVLFFDINNLEAATEDTLPTCACVAQLGGPEVGVTGRIKDFEVLPCHSSAAKTKTLLVTANSDGAIRLWTLPQQLAGGQRDVDPEELATTRQVGKLIGTLETGSRITCLGAFVMDGKADDNAEEEAVED